METTPNKKKQGNKGKQRKENKIDKLGIDDNKARVGESFIRVYQNATVTKSENSFKRGKAQVKIKSHLHQHCEKIKANCSFQSKCDVSKLRTPHSPLCTSKKKLLCSS